MRKRDHDGWESQLFQEPMLGAQEEEARNFVQTLVQLVTLDLFREMYTTTTYCSRVLE